MGSQNSTTRGTGKTGMTREQYLASVRKPTKGAPAKKTPAATAAPAEPASPDAMAAIAEMLKRAGYQIEKAPQPMQVGTVQQLTTEPVDQKTVLDAALEADVQRDRTQPRPAPRVAAAPPAQYVPRDSNVVDLNQVHAAGCASRSTDEYERPQPCNCHVSPGEYVARVAPGARRAPQPPEPQFCVHGIETIAPGNGCQHEPLEHASEIMAPGSPLKQMLEDRIMAGKAARVVKVAFRSSDRPYVANHSPDALTSGRVPAGWVEMYGEFEWGLVIVFFRATAGGPEQVTVIPWSNVKSAQIAL